MPKLNYRAKLLIYDLPTMPKKIRNQLSSWLMRIAIEFKTEKDPKIYVKRYIAKLMK